MSKLKNSVRNNSVSTLLPPRVPDLPGENGGPHPHAKPPSSSILNTVNKSTNKGRASNEGSQRYYNQAPTKAFSC